MSVKTYLNPQAGLGLSKIFVGAPTGIPSVDTATIQSAIAKLTALGGNATVTFQDGAYVVNGNSCVVQGLSNFTLTSAGSTIIQQAPNTAAIPYNTSMDLFVVADCTNFVIRDGLIFDGQRDQNCPIVPLLGSVTSGSTTYLEIPAGYGSNYFAGTAPTGSSIAVINSAGVSAQHVTLFSGMYSGTLGATITGVSAVGSSYTFTTTNPHYFTKGLAASLTGLYANSSLTPWSGINSAWQVTSVPSTTVTSGSYGVNVSTITTLNVSSTSGFASSGRLGININGSYVVFAYTGTGTNTFTGVTLVSGTGTLQISASYNAVYGNTFNATVTAATTTVLSGELNQNISNFAAHGLCVSSLSGFPASGTITGYTNNGAATWTYTSLSTTLTGATASSTSSTITITVGNNLTAGQQVTLSGFSVAAYNTTWTIATASTTAFTITSTLNPGTATGGSVTYAALSGLTLTVGTGTWQFNSSNQSVSALPYISGSPQAVAYGSRYGDGKGDANAISTNWYDMQDTDLFITAISPGTGAHGGDVLTIQNTGGSGTISANSYFAVAPQCSAAVLGTTAGPVGTTTSSVATIASLIGSSLPVASTAGLPTNGQVVGVTTTGNVILSYTGITGTNLTGIGYVSGSSAGSFSASYNNIYPTINTIIAGTGLTVASTTGFPSVGAIYLSTSGSQVQLSYSGVTSTSFTGLVLQSGTGTAALTAASNAVAPTTPTIVYTYTGAPYSVFVGDVVIANQFSTGYNGEFTIAQLIGTQPGITAFTVNVSTTPSTATSAANGYILPMQSDGFGPMAGYGAYLTGYMPTTGYMKFTVAGRTLWNEDQQCALHLMNCQGFMIRGVVCRNMWMSGIKLGTGFDNPLNVNNGYGPLANGCSFGLVTENRVYHGYDQGISLWCCTDVAVANNPQLQGCGWAGVSMTQSDDCTITGNVVWDSYYRQPKDLSSGSGFAIEGGTGNLVNNNVVENPWGFGIQLLVAPLAFGLPNNTATIGYSPVLSSAITCGDPAGTAYTFTTTSGYVPLPPYNGTIPYMYSLQDGSHTEKVWVTSVSTVGSTTTVTFRDPCKFSHATGIYLTASIATDNIVENNTFNGTSLNSNISAAGGARNIIKDNNCLGNATLPGVVTPSASGILLGDYANYGVVIGGEGSVITGNKVVGSWSQGIALGGASSSTNQVSYCLVKDNVLGPSRGGIGTPMIQEFNQSDYNVILNNSSDSGWPYISVITANMTTSSYGLHTKFISGPGLHCSALDQVILNESGKTVYWKLNDTTGAFADYSGNKNVVSPTSGGSPTYAYNSVPCTSALLDQCLKLNGSSYVNTGKNWAYGTMSVELMFNLMNTTFTGTMDLVSNDTVNGGTPSNKGFRIYLTGSATPGQYTLNAAFGNTATSTVLTSTIYIPVNGWNHVVATYYANAAGSAYLYLNGQQVAYASVGSAASVTNGTNNISFGYNQGLAGNYFTGGLAKFVIYQKTLTAAQVLTHSNAAFAV